MVSNLCQRTNAKRSPFRLLAPIYDDNEFKAVIVSEAQDQHLQRNILERTERKTDASVYIIDQQQRLVAHSGSGSVIFGAQAKPIEANAY